MPLKTRLKLSFKFTQCSYEQISFFLILKLTVASTIYLNFFVLGKLRGFYFKLVATLINRGHHSG